MIHPDDSILLAYIRKQSCDEWEGSTQEHVDDCDSCHTRYMELLHADALVNDAVTLSIDQTYASVADSVLHRIERSKSSFVRRRRRGSTLSILFARPRFVNVALGLVICCALVATAITFFNLRHPTNTSGSQQKVSVATAAPRATIDIPGHIAHMPIATPIATPTATPVIHVPTIYECQQADDEAHKRLRICGEYFTPKDSIQLDFTIPGSRNSKTHRGIIVQDDGTFQDTLSISSCRSIPSAVRAYDQVHLSEVSQVFQDIQLNSCFSSVEVIKNRRRRKSVGFCSPRMKEERTHDC